MSELKCPNIKIYKCSDGFVTDNAQVAKSHEANIKSNKLICPFCNSELNKDSDGFYTCYTDNCGCMALGGNGASGSKSLWLALIDTKKKLDIAVDALSAITATPLNSRVIHDVGNKALEQINQKENQ